jgi:hypothetical protein
LADLLGGDFELEFEEGEMRMTGRSGDEVWRLFRACEGPAKLLVDSLDRERAEDYRQAFVRHYERHRKGDGVSRPRRYLLTLGRRRPTRASAALATAPMASSRSATSVAGSAPSSPSSSASRSTSRRAAV